MRQKYNQNSSKNRIFIIGFIVIAIASIIVCILCKNALEKIEKDHSGSNFDSKNTVSVTQADTTEESSAVPEDCSTTDESSLVTSFSEMCKQMTDMNIILDKDTNKTYKIDLCNLANQGDRIASFTFTFYSEDGTSNMGNVKGGFGISVDPSCPAMTDDSWYQNPNDFSVYSEGAKCEVTWNVPDEIKDYINVNTGKLLFGYWWSDVTSIRLDKVLCKKSTTKDIPVDGNNKINIGQTLSYSDASPQKFTFPISSLIKDDQIPQFISIQCSCNNPVELFTGQLGITTSSLNDKYFSENNNVVFSDSNSATFDWFIPEEITKDVDHNGNIDLTLSSPDNQDITIDFIYVQYSTKK